VRTARLAFLLAAASASTGCERAQVPAPPSAPAAPRLQPRQDLPEEVRALDLFGAWLADPEPAQGEAGMDQGWPTVLLAGSRQLQVVSQCVTIGSFAYGMKERGKIVIFEPEVPPLSSPGRVPPLVQCARALSPTEARLGPLLLNADRAVRQSDGTITLSGKAGALRLRRPAGALANPVGQTPPPALPPLLGAWRFVRVQGRDLPQGEQMELLFRPPFMEWRSGCVNEARGLTSVQDGRLTLGPIDPFPVCERGRSEAELAVARLTSGPIQTSMQRDGRLRLDGSGITAELVPLT
jgi:hypothetical protein